MFGIKFKKAAIMLPLALVSVALATPAAAANWFSPDPATGVRRHIGSAPNPTAQDIRESRKAANEPTMSLLMKENGTPEVKILLDSDGAARAILIGDTSDFAYATTGKPFSVTAIR